MARRNTPAPIPADAATDPMVSTGATAAPMAPQAPETTDAAGGVAAPSAASADLHPDEIQTATANPMAPQAPETIDAAGDVAASPEASVEQQPIVDPNAHFDEESMIGLQPVQAVVVSPIMLDDEALAIGDLVTLSWDEFAELSKAGAVEAA